MVLIKNEATNFNANIGNNVAFISFMWKTKSVGETPKNNDKFLKSATIAVPLKYQSNFRRWLEMSLINCKVLN